MIQVIAASKQNTAGHTRRWMLISFIAGLVFTAALAQYLAAANSDVQGSIDLPGTSQDHHFIAPAPTPDYYLINSYCYRLVYTCPQGEARILV
jgi:hypothetical protein